MIAFSFYSAVLCTGGQASLTTITAVSVAAVTCSAVALCAGILLTTIVYQICGLGRCSKPSTNLEQQQPNDLPIYEEACNNSIIELQQNAAYTLVQPSAHN